MITGERIRARRKELHISADILAEAIGVDRSTVFRYERGDIEKLPISALEPVAKILNTTVAYLMGWSDEKESPLTGNQQRDLIRALKDIGALTEDGQLSDRGRIVVTDMLRNNANMLKKLIDEKD